MKKKRLLSALGFHRSRYSLEMSYCKAKKHFQFELYQKSIFDIDNENIVQLLVTHVTPRAPDSSCLFTVSSVIIPRYKSKQVSFPDIRASSGRCRVDIIRAGHQKSSPFQGELFTDVDIRDVDIRDIRYKRYKR